jgi:hypothetical protein
MNLCERCGAPIVLAVTVGSAKVIYLDATPDPTGRALWFGGPEQPLSVMLLDGSWIDEVMLDDPPECRYTVHDDTCIPTRYRYLPPPLRHVDKHR